jgi:hypothetical protein
MKAKKAIKRLDHVETLLSDVIDQFAGADGMRELLDSAKEAVFRAKATVIEQRKQSGEKASAVKRKGIGAATATRKAASKTA